MNREEHSQNVFVTSDWWDEDSFLHGLHTLLDPVRIPYFKGALASNPDVHLLDVGCGGGFVSSALSSAGYRVTGIDISLDAIRSARQSSEGCFAVGDAHDLPFAEDTFDAVVCSEVLEHVHDFRRVISECARVIKPAGRFLFSTPNRTMLSRFALIELAQRWWPTRVLPHDLHRWETFITPSELSDSLAANQLSVEAIHGITISLRQLPRTAMTLYQLKRDKIGYAEAGRRIQLRLGRATAVSYIGTAISLKSGRS